MIQEITAILKRLPAKSQQEVLDFAQFVERQQKGKSDRRRQSWENRNRDNQGVGGSNPSKPVPILSQFPPP